MVLAQTVLKIFEVNKASISIIDRGTDIPFNGVSVTVQLVQISLQHSRAPPHCTTSKVNYALVSLSSLSRELLPIIAW